MRTPAPPSAPPSARQPPSDLAVACGRSRRDAADGVPYAPLERGAANVEREVETLRGGIDEAHHLGHELLEGLVAADQPRVRETILQTAHQPIRIVAEVDRTDALVRRRDQDRSERAFADRKADDVAAAAGAELRRRHAEQPGRRGIEAAAGIEAAPQIASVTVSRAASSSRTRLPR